MQKAKNEANIRRHHHSDHAKLNMLYNTARSFLRIHKGRETERERKKERKKERKSAGRLSKEQGQTLVDGSRVSISRQTFVGFASRKAVCGSGIRCHA